MLHILPLGQGSFKVVEALFHQELMEVGIRSHQGGEEMNGSDGDDNDQEDVDEGQGLDPAGGFGSFQSRGSNPIVGVELLWGKQSFVAHDVAEEAQILEELLNLDRLLFRGGLVMAGTGVGWSVVSDLGGDISCNPAGLGCRAEFQVAEGDNALVGLISSVFESDLSRG